MKQHSYNENLSHPVVNEEIDGKTRTYVKAWIKACSLNWPKAKNYLNSLKKTAFTPRIWPDDVSEEAICSCRCGTGPWRILLSSFESYSYPRPLRSWTSHRNSMHQQRSCWNFRCNMPLGTYSTVWLVSKSATRRLGGIVLKIVTWYNDLKVSSWAGGTLRW